jgi:hypothetical protein
VLEGMGFASFICVAAEQTERLDRLHPLIGRPPIPARHSRYNARTHHQGASQVLNLFLPYLTPAGLALVDTKPANLA